jgi:protocatechuate 3,4-dioxygenase beta subunit
MGVAACGDDVTVTEAPPPPPPPLTVSMTPSNASVTVGESAVFAVGVSGGAEGAQATWTCSSSNTSVASVAVTAAGCRATSVAAGTASITATVTKGNQSANAGAQLTVVAPPTPPTTPLQVSISPSNQTIGIGEAAIFAVGITGGSGTLSHTCTSSAPGVASVAKTDAGCEATGVAAGNATILIAVTKGSETVNVAGQVTVTATPEPAPLAITMTPASQSILVGETAVFAVGITGGATGATVERTCASSNPAVATADTTSAGCRVEGLAAGNASITVTVTKGEQTATAASQISVTAPAEPIPATVSISSITKGGLTEPVSVNNVGGQIDVTLNVVPNDQRVTRVEVLVGETVAARQDISGGAAASAASEALQLITLSFNTNAYCGARGNTALEQAACETLAPGTALYRNGARQIRARLFAEGAEGEPAASNVVTLQFNNQDGFHVVGSYEGASVLDAQGRRWIGGPDFELTVTALPVLYGTKAVNRIEVSVCGQTRAPWTPESESETATFTFTCAGFEGTGVAPVITSRYADDDTGVTGGILNLAATPDDHPFPARIDVKGPTGGSIGIAAQTGLSNEGNWINAAYSFATGAGAVSALADGGVGLPATAALRTAARRYAVSTGATVATAIVGPQATLTGADLEETTTNTAYRAWVFDYDLLGNATGVISAAGDESNPLATFGVDKTGPTLEILGSTGSLDEEEVETFQAAGGALGSLSVRATSIRSGFPQAGAARDATVRVVGSPTGATTRTVTLRSSTAAASVADPFAAANGDSRILTNLAHYNTPAASFPDQTRMTFTADAGAATFGYYVYQWEVRDRAGNVVRGHRKVYVNGAAPTLEVPVAQPAFTPATVFEAFRVTEPVELGEGAFALSYTNTGGRLIYERETSALSSALRATVTPALGDGELFNNSILTRVDNLRFSTGGVFFRTIQGVTSAGVPNTATFASARPTAVDVQVFNAFGIQSEDAGFGAAAGGSAVRNRTIVATDVTAGVNFATIQPVAPATLASWTFRLVDGSAPDCNAAFCVRAEQTGAGSANFTNPFTGPVFIAWADNDQANPDWRVLKEATPNFAGNVPTRSTANSRIYEWTFDLAGANPGDVQTLQLAAIGTRGSGDAMSGLVTTWRPTPEFNVVFTPSAAEIATSGTPSSAAFTLAHGSNSTGASFTRDACLWVDAAGNSAAAPQGLTLAATSNGCTVTRSGAPLLGGVYYVKATAISGTTTASAIGTITVVAPTFAPTLSPTAATVEKPQTGTAAPVTFALEMSEVASFTCAIAGEGATLPTVARDGNNCVVTYGAGTTAGTYQVTATAVQTVTGTVATTAPVTFTVHDRTTFSAPESVTLAYAAADSSVALVTLQAAGGVRTLQAAGTIICDLSPVLTGFTALATPTGCRITVANTLEARQAFINAYEAEEEIQLTLTYTSGAQAGLPARDAEELTVDVVLGAPVGFAPSVTPATAADDRRVIQGPGIAQFNLGTTNLGLGLPSADADAAEITVQPAGQGVTAVFTRGSGPNPQRFVAVTIAPGANVDFYDIEVTWKEAGTDRTATTMIYIDVQDAGGFGADPTLSTAEVTTAQPVLVGTAARVKVTALNRLGAPMAGLLVEIAATQAPNTSTIANVGFATTNAQGEAFFDITDTTSGTRIFDVRVGGTPLAELLEIEFIPGEAAEIDLEVSVNEESVDNEATLIATVTDEFGNLVADGTEVTFDIGGAITVGSDLLAAIPSAGIFPATEETVDGIATFTFNEENAGTYSYVATSGSAESDPVDVTWTAGVAGTVTLAASDDEPTAGTDLVLTAEVLDQYGNPVAGETVTFSGEGVEDTTATTNEDGIATTTANYTVAGEQEYTASIGNGAAASVTVEWQPDEAYSMELALDPDTAEQTVGEDVTITVTVFDVHGNTVDDVEVYLIVGTSTIDTETIVATETTDADGKATFTVMNTVAGELDYLFDGNTDRIVRASTTITWIPGAPSAAGTTVAFEDGDDELLSATTTDEITIEITAPTSNGKFFIQVRDQYGNAVEGIRQISWTDSRAGFTGTSVETNAAGLAQINIPGTIGVDDVFTFYLGSVANDDRIATVTFELDTTPFFVGFLNYAAIGDEGDFLASIRDLFDDPALGVASTTPLFGAAVIQSASGYALELSDFELYEWKLVEVASSSEAASGFTDEGDLDVATGGAGPVFGLFEGVPIIFWILPEVAGGAPTYTGPIAVAFKKVGSTGAWSYLIDLEDEDGVIWATTSWGGPDA